MPYYTPLIQLSDIIEELLLDASLAAPAAAAFRTSISSLLGHALATWRPHSGDEQGGDDGYSGSARLSGKAEDWLAKYEDVCDALSRVAVVAPQSLRCVRYRS